LTDRPNRNKLFGEATLRAFEPHPTRNRAYAARHAAIFLVRLRDPSGIAHP